MSDLYLQSAGVIDAVLAQKGSVKGLVMDRAKKAKLDPKRLLALTANTLAFRSALEHALQRSNVESIEKRVLQTACKGACTAKSLALVLAHDLLLTKRARIATSPAWPPHTALARHGARLRAELVKLQIQQGKSSIQQLRSGDAVRRKVERIPRWIRVNERLIAVDKAIEQLQSEGWQQVHLGSALQGKRKTFARSTHVPSVLAVHVSHTSQFLTHPLFVEGKLIMQDLASCFPAQILLGQLDKGNGGVQNEADNKGGTSSLPVVHALDATAAPGNKTSHLSAILARTAGKGSKVSAFEHMKPRFETLQKQLQRAGGLRKDKPGPVTAVLGDFTKQDPSQYKDVTHMLLDPSCSGSGILGRLDYLTATEEAAEETASPSDKASGETDADQQSQRLKGLAAFQSAMIDHAMRFPALHRLVYSTCSVHHEENEEVVMRALASDVARLRGWTLARRQTVIPSWPTRGLAQYCDDDATLADGMIRCVPGGSHKVNEDDGAVECDLEATNGFFVACFERVGDAAASAGAAQTDTSEPVKVNANSEKNRKRKSRAKEKAKEAKKAKLADGQ